MDFGNKIMKLRKQLGLSQEELAEKLGVARQTISKWELGETAPDLKQSKELSKIFNVSLDELTDNDIKEVLVEKVSNTEKTSKKTLSILKILATAIIVFILLFIEVLEKEEENLKKQFIVNYTAKSIHLVLNIMN